MGSGRNRVSSRLWMIALLMVSLVLMANIAAMAKPNKAPNRPSQTIDVEWYYVWDGEEGKPELPSPFHVFSSHKGRATSIMYTQVLDWDIWTIYDDVQTFAFLGYDDTYSYETLFKGKIVTDDFPYNDIPNNEGEPWDKHPETT